MRLVIVLTALLLCVAACGNEGGDKDVNEGVNIKPCLPQCEGKECGPDGCEDFCGFCPNGYECQEGMCGVECIPACAGVECGDGGCGVSCGSCADGMKCEEGECIADCTDDCSYGQSGCDGAFRLVCGYHDEDPCLDWSPPESCPPEAPCKDGKCTCPKNCEGKECGSDGCGGMCGTCNPLGSCSDGLCVCNWGACAEGDNLTEVCENKDLKLCEVWTCDDGCCNSEKLLEEDCCTSHSDCEDCTDLESGETAVCPEDAPEGAVKNLCTTQSCDLMQGTCTYEPVNIGDCDDENECTIDSCDPAKGECGHVIDPDVPECNVTPCWAATEEEADALCKDEDLCTLDACVYEDDFVAWESEELPDVSNPLDLPEGVGVCGYEDVVELGLCGGGDPCYEYGCDAETGCWETVLIEEPGCCGCIVDADCAGLDEDPCAIATCHLSCTCIVVEPICDDEDDCTIDSCDGDSEPDQDYPCVHEPDPLCNGGCLVNEDCPPPVDCCAQVLCLFEPGAEVGECAELALTNDCASCVQHYCDEVTNSCVTETADCDDGDECTLDDCECSDEPFGSGCVHEDVPDC